MSPLPGKMWQFIERRWVLNLLATIIGLTSIFFLLSAIRIAYVDYWFEPREKAADPGLYIYPQLRYTIFSLVLIVWSTTGLIAAIMSFRGAISSGSVSEWTRRVLILYFVLFAVLILGGTLMIFMRSYGY
jgi:Trk-type K+ transport system membrane component